MVFIRLSNVCRFVISSATKFIVIIASVFKNMCQKVLYSILDWSCNYLMILKDKMCSFITCCMKQILSHKLISIIIITISITLLVSWHLMKKKYIYVLLWNRVDSEPFKYLTVKDVFLTNNCSFNNCYVTADKSYFGGDLSRFHAIAFSGLEIDFTKAPRNPNQKFIYFNLSPPEYTPINEIKYNGYYNWTSTYKLESDIPYPYILIKDSVGNIVGPKPDMKWKVNTMEVDEDVSVHLLNKSKTAAIVLSSCRSLSGREELILRLKESLMGYGHDLDVYGKCGKKCENYSPECDHMVEGYYFYLAFEDSLSKDYVTKQLLRALNYYAIPVVYGGADYSRFLPPGSYINARNYTPNELASVMDELMKQDKRLEPFYRWRKDYSYHDPLTKENVCALCEALNDKSKYETPSILWNIGGWWNGEL